MRRTDLLAKAEGPSQPAPPGRIGHPGQGEGPASKGVMPMWLLPLSITLDVKKTRRSWTLRLRVSFFT